MRTSHVGLPGLCVAHQVLAVAFLTSVTLILRTANSKPTTLLSSPLSTTSLRLPIPTTLSGFLFQPPLWLFSNLSFLPHFWSRRRSRAQAFVWFRAKTKKSSACCTTHIVSHYNKVICKLITSLSNGFHYNKNNNFSWKIWL